MKRRCYPDGNSRWHPRTPPGERSDIADAPRGAPSLRYGPVTFPRHPNRGTQNMPAPMPVFWQRQHVPVPTISGGHTRPRPKTAHSMSGSQHSHNNIHRPEIPRPRSANTTSSHARKYSNLGVYHGEEPVASETNMSALSDIYAGGNSGTPRHDEHWHTYPQSANVANHGDSGAAALNDSLEKRLFYHARKELKHTEDEESSRQRACGKSRESRPKTAPVTRSTQSTPLDFKKRPTTAKPKRPSSHNEPAEAPTPPQDMPAASSSSSAPIVAFPAHLEPKAAGMPNITPLDMEKTESKENTRRTYMQMAGIPDRADFPFGPSKGWAAKRQSRSMFSFNPIRHTVDKFVVKDGQLQQERTSYTDPVPHLADRKFNRVKGVVEYDDLTRPTAARWNPSYQERFQNNHRVFYKQTGTIMSFVDNMLKQGYKPNAA
eukprot:GEMP01023547.1.p1 GENE.GEMP01023547.1~~GEMP01023547.1.p1  ORF type:complete len:432 (+),score=91.78 GEMP01023547.1:88-1383(+)